MFFIQFFLIYVWIEFPFKSLGSEQTDTADFGICKSSFVALPSITVNGPQKSQQVCITQHPKAIDVREVCSEDEPYDNNRACIAVYYLRRYNIPLFTAFRIRATKNNPLQVTSCTRDDCWRHAKRRWAFQASSTDGHFNVLCKIQKGNWKFDVGSFPDQYNRGHLVPCALGKKISVTMGAATFNIFNVGPQQKQANSVLSSYEDNMIKFATEKCLDTAVITGNVVRDFYFISGTSPDLSYPKKVD